MQLVPTVADVERAILAAEGPFTVAGRYIADAGLCARERRRIAEQRVATAARHAAYLAAHPVPTVCRWCEQVVGADVGVTVIVDAVICDRCVDEYDRFVFGAALPSDVDAAPLDESDVAVTARLTGAYLGAAVGADLRRDAPALPAPPMTPATARPLAPRAA